MAIIDAANLIRGGLAQLLADEAPTMALNLDMGAYNFCRDNTRNCVDPSAGFDALTNLIVLYKP